MSELLAYLTVFVAAAIPWLEVLLVVPAGIVAGLAPVPTAIVGAAGNVATLVPLVIGGDRLRERWRARRAVRRERAAAAVTSQQPEDVTDDRDHEPSASAASSTSSASPKSAEPSGRGRRARRLFDRFGLPGLAVLGPLVTGIHVAAVVGLAAGAPRRATLVWTVAGVVVWSAVVAAATVFGLDALVDPEDLPQLFT